MTERAYKVWKIKLDLSSKQAHKLISPTSSGGGYEWKPGENISSAGGQSMEAFKQYGWGSGPGFYSVRRPEELIEQNYYPPQNYLGTVGEIIPYGKVEPGTKGFRSEKAQISGIFEETEDYNLCEVCRKSPASRVLTLGEGRESFNVCKTCGSKIKKVVKKSEELGRHEMYLGLATHYDVPLLDLPDVFKITRK